MKEQLIGFGAELLVTGTLIVLLFLGLMNYGKKVDKDHEDK